MLFGEGNTRYNGYGFREEWLNMFFVDSVAGDFWRNNNLGSSQLPALKNYLFDSGIITKAGKLTELGEILREFWFLAEEKLVWGIIFVELSWNSPLFRWWKEIKWGSVISRKEMEEKLANKKAVLSLVNTLLESPIGEICGGVLKVSKKKTDFLYYKCGSEIHRYVIAYSLYKKLREEGWNGTTVSDIYSEKNELCYFGMSRREFERALRTLDWEGVISVDLVLDLDNIFLKPFTPIEVLEFCLEKMERDKEKQKFKKVRNEFFLTQKQIERRGDDE